MDWSKIDSSTFEKLCCEYANKEYSDLIWEPTGQSWDNNRDGEFQEKIKRLNRTFKGWYECKYTYDSNNVISKSHMDSTLVSGILDGEVIYILFITNGRITSEFRQRAFAILRPHQIEVNFIDGEMLEKWIENNTEIYYAYFHEKIQNQSKKQTVSIDDIKIFDSVFFSPNFLCPVKEIIVSKEYFIYICVKASAQFSFTVKLSTSNLRILDQRLYTVYPGYNNVLIRCVAKNTCKKQTIGFSLLEEGTKKVLCNKRIENFCIEPSQCPEIIYYSQTKIMQEMFNYINTNSHNNRILALAAEGGMGKSYLVQNLIASLIKPNSLFMGGYFSEKTAENACVLCKLILFLSFGTLYELNEESFLLLVEQYTSMPISLLLLLKTGTYNQIVATSAISKYYDYLNNNQDISSYVGGFNEKFFVNPSYIYIEDCQKLSTKYLKLLSLILNDFKKKKYFQHIVITFRTNETMTEKVENMLSELSCPIWKLDGITKNDLAETMIHHFSERVKTISLSLPLPVNVLHFSAIITSLKSKNINSNNENLPQVIYETYQEINSLDDGYIINQFKESNYFDVLSLIYSIETGIPTNVLVSYLHEAGNQIINELKSKHQVKEENGLLKPYHDSYISAFHSFQAQKESENSIKKFLEFCLKSSFETKIIESIMISLLLNKRVYSFPDILLLYQRCLTYYNSSDYETAQIISKRIKDEETIDLEKQVYLRYIYAQCLKTTSSHKKSNDEYKKLESFIYMNGNSENNLGFLYDCISEIINNDLWMFNFEELELYLGRLKNIQTFPNSHPNLVNGYLNYHNRSMMYYSFIVIAPVACHRTALSA